MDDRDPFDIADAARINAETGLFLLAVLCIGALLGFGAALAVMA